MRVLTNQKLDRVKCEERISSKPRLRARPAQVGSASYPCRPSSWPYQYSPVNPFLYLLIAVTSPVNLTHYRLEHCRNRLGPFSLAFPLLHVRCCSGDVPALLFPFRALSGPSRSRFCDFQSSVFSLIRRPMHTRSTGSTRWQFLIRSKRSFRFLSRFVQRGDDRNDR